MKKRSEGPKAVLRKAYDLLAKEGTWTQHAYARDKNGTSCGEKAKGAVSWCAVGALYKVASTADAAQAALDLVSEKIVDINDRAMSVLPVLRCYRRAIDRKVK